MKTRYMGGKPIKFQTLGFYYRTGSETFKQALAYCHDPVDALGLFRTVSRTRKAIEFDKKQGFISKNSKPKIFKVTIEEV